MPNSKFVFCQARTGELHHRECAQVASTRMETETGRKMNLCPEHAAAFVGYSQLMGFSFKDVGPRADMDAFEYMMDLVSPSTGDMPVLEALVKTARRFPNVDVEVLVENAMEFGKFQAADFN